MSIATSIATLIDVQNRCSRLNTVLALPRKSGPEVGPAHEDRLHLPPEGIAEALLGEPLRAGPRPQRVEAPLEGLEAAERIDQGVGRGRLEEDAGLWRECLQRPAPG